MTGFKNRERASTPSKVHCQNNTFHKFEVGTLPLNGLINEKLNGVGKPQSETKKNKRKLKNRWEGWNRVFFYSRNCRTIPCRRLCRLATRNKNIHMLPRLLLLRLLFGELLDRSENGPSWLRQLPFPPQQLHLFTFCFVRGPVSTPCPLPGKVCIDQTSTCISKEGRCPKHTHVAMSHPLCTWWPLFGGWPQDLWKPVATNVFNRIACHHCDDTGGMSSFFQTSRHT